MGRPIRPRYACIGISLVVVACQAVPPPIPPEPADIAQQAAVLSASPLATTPGTYVSVGYGLVESNCRKFFDGIDKAQDKANFERKELTLGGAAAAGILKALAAGVVPITITAIAVPLVADSIENYQNFILVTPYPDATYTLIKAALKTYRDNVSAPIDIYTGQSMVQAYAAICTYSGIHQLAKEALTKAKTQDGPTTTSFAAPAAPAIMGRAPAPAGVGTSVHIPNVVVQ